MGSSKKSTDLYKQAGDEIEMLRKSSRSRNSRSRPSSTKFPKSQQQHHVSSKDNNKNGDMSGMQIDLSRSAAAGGKYRNKVLAEVGLDDILVDDYDEEIDIQQQQHNSIKKNTRKDRKKSRRRKVRLSQELRTNEAARIKANMRSNDDDDYEDENDEEEGLNYNEEDELYPDDEYDDSFNNSNEERSNSSYCNATMRRIIGKLLYVSIAIVFALYIFYGDEIFTNTTANEDVGNDEETANHPAKDGYIEGYKDARVPDDDIAQFGGGILGAEAFGKKNEGGGLDFFNDDDQQQNVETEEEEEQKQQQPGVHEHTGIAKTDLLWEQLDGYSEMVVPYDSEHELPVFWHVPKCGGTTLQDLLMHCFGLVGANEIGAAYVKDAPPLNVVKLENGNRYVNVDMSNPAGITHAKEMGFAQSGLANIIMTSWLDQTAAVFDDNEHKGRCFTLLRHPIKRAVSMFYYLKDATWEHTYSEVYKSMTIEEYAISEYAEDNWMTRFLTNEMAGGIYEEHLDLAKEVLESKCLVGLMEEFTPSIKRFNQYFGWMNMEFGGSVPMKDRATCVSRVIGHPDNKHPHPEVEEGGDVWNLLMQKNELDVALYEHAVHLFHDVQNKLVDE